MPPSAIQASEESWCRAAPQRAGECMQGRQPRAQSRQQRVKKQFGEGPSPVTLCDPKGAWASPPTFSPAHGVSLQLLPGLWCCSGAWGAVTGKNNPVRPREPQSFLPGEGQGQGIKNKGTRNSNLCSAQNSNRVVAGGVRGHTQR